MPGFQKRRGMTSKVSDARGSQRVTFNPPPQCRRFKRFASVIISRRGLRGNPVLVRKLNAMWKMIGLLAKLDGTVLCQTGVPCRDAGDEARKREGLNGAVHLKVLALHVSRRPAKSHAQ
jgi:hypothetical protein